MKSSAKKKREVSPLKSQKSKEEQANGKRLTRSKSKRQINSGEKLQKKSTKSAPKNYSINKLKKVPKENKKIKKAKAMKK